MYCAPVSSMQPCAIYHPPVTICSPVLNTILQCLYTTLCYIPSSSLYTTLCYIQCLYTALCYIPSSSVCIQPCAISHPPVCIQPCAIYSVCIQPCAIYHPPVSVYNPVLYTLLQVWISLLVGTTSRRTASQLRGGVTCVDGSCGVWSDRE